MDNHHNAPQIATETSDSLKAQIEGHAQSIETVQRLIDTYRSKLIMKQEQTLRVEDHVMIRRVAGGFIYFIQVHNRSTSQTHIDHVFTPFGPHEQQETRNHIDELKNDVVTLEQSIKELHARLELLSLHAGDDSGARAAGKDAAGEKANNYRKGDASE